MASYAALVSLSQTIDQILHHHHHHHDQSSSTFLHGKQQIESLHDHVVFLQAFLEDFPEKLLANNLEERVRDIAHDAENIIESYYMMEENRSDLVFGQVSQKLIKVTEEIHSLAGQVMEIKNNSVNDSSTASSSSRPVLLAPETGKNAMVGFDVDLLAIKARLRGESSKLEIIPIFGMGGIGKTTLAKNVYDDQLTVEHFDIRAWVTVSQDYSEQKILSSLLVSFKAVNDHQSPELKADATKKKKNEEKKEIDIKDMEDLVYKSLKGRRYLIVMDDMWSTKAWDDVWRLFPDDNYGSRIMLTTRLSDVATYTTNSSSPIHEMQFMDLDQSWDLLRQKVFKQEHSFPRELEEIGRKVAKSCRGLPLAIVVFAGILSTVSQTRASWEKIAENVTFSVTTNIEQFAKILSLSYVNLPHHLRPCFLYMGGFPEDYEIRVSRLVKLWVAEGFLKVPSSGSKSYEEWAEEYLEDLVKRSLVLVITRKYNGKIKSCGLHDLVRDLCVKKAEEEKFHVHVKEILTESIKHERRVSIIRHERYWDDDIPNISGSTIRTLLFFPECLYKLSYLKYFRFLSVLDALKLKFTKFPAQVLELFHLTYLAFSIYWYEKTYYRENYVDITAFYFDVPSSIFKLKNLQTIFLPSYKKDTYPNRYIDFPPEIWRLTQLRHLILPTVHLLHYPRPSSFALENLQTLALVGNFQCTEEILKMIPNLRKLRLVYDGHGIGWTDYQLDNLVHFHRLEKLTIHMEYNPHYRVVLWEQLAFPSMLKSLTLRGFCLCAQNMKIVGSLPNLEVLKLRNCLFADVKWETTEGEFPRLKFLDIKDTYLQHWITESSHFPILERLMLCHCMKLREIPDVIGEIPTLELIEVSKRDISLMESAKRIKDEQLQDYGNDSLQVRFVDYNLYC